MPSGCLLHTRCRLQTCGSSRFARVVLRPLLCPKRRRRGGRWMGVRSVHEALGILRGSIYIHARTTCTAAGVASSGGRGRASSAAACPSLGSRTPISFTTARRPRTYVSARPRGCLFVGLMLDWRGQARRGRRCTPASCAGHAWRQACERLSAGWRVPAEPTMFN